MTKNQMTLGSIKQSNATRVDILYRKEGCKPKIVIKRDPSVANSVWESFFNFDSNLLD